MDIETIYLEFDTRLKRFILKRVSDAETAEDILQDVYLKIHSHIGSLRSSDRLESWIYQIARNAITDHYRRTRNLVELRDLPVQSEDLDEDDGDLTDSVWSMLEDLPEKYRQALLMVDYHGKTQQQLAETAGISLSGAKSRVQRARKMVKELLLECCHFEFDRQGRVIDHYPKCYLCCPEEQ